MLITALSNQKGGVGKTTVTAGVAEELASRGLRVLILDADPQANLTARLGIEVGETQLTLNDVLGTIDTEGGDVDGFDDHDYLGAAIAPSGPRWSDLIGVVPAELGLSSQEKVQSIGGEFRLRVALGNLRTEWDHVLIDCPPSLGLLTLNAMIAANQVIAVTEAAALPVQGLAYMIRTLGTVKKHYNPNLRLSGVVINRYRADRRDRAAWSEKLRASYGSLVIAPAMPEREVIAQANSASLPLAELGGTASAVADVREAMAAIADRIAGDEQ